LTVYCNIQIVHIGLRRVNAKNDQVCNCVAAIVPHKFRRRSKALSDTSTLFHF
jgi:hypothetical protein